MNENEVLPESSEREPKLTWWDSFANDIGTSYLLRDESREGRPVVGGYVVDNATGFIFLLNDDNSEKQPLFHHELDVVSAREVVERDYLKSLANSTSHDTSHDASDEQPVHQS